MTRLATAVTTVALLAVALLPAAATGAARSCGGRVIVGPGHGVQITASDIHAQNLSCQRAHGIARAFISKKIFGHPVEQCAAAAEGAGGCEVDGFRCRTPNRGPPIRSRCSAGDRVVSFTEMDADRG